MNSFKTMKVVSRRLVVKISATDDEITLDVLPYKLKRHAEAVEKFILYTAVFDTDAYTSTLDSNEEYWLNVDRILSFIKSFDIIKVRKNSIPRLKIREATETTEALCSSLEAGHLVATFTFKREHLNSLIPEYQRVRFDMKTFGKLTYLSYISCEAIGLARQALAYEDFW